MHRYHWILITALLVGAPFAFSQSTKGKSKGPKKAEPFAWSNPLSKEQLAKYELPKGLSHQSFSSPSMGVEVGYFIYLPEDYASSGETAYNVVFHLHGGRPGSERKSIKLAKYVDAAIKEQVVAPTIYVWPNGGPMSWYNYPQIENGQGEDVFVKELIPHIQKTYRTNKMAIEGFSQGGRGTTRIMFKYPDLFTSAAPGGSGYEPEKRIQENDGAESDRVKFAKGYNAWDLADEYAKREDKTRLPIMLWVGTKGFNYEFNLKFSENLKSLGIPHQMLIVEGADHSAVKIYEAKGDELMKFHQQGFSGIRIGSTANF